MKHDETNSGAIWAGTSGSAPTDHDPPMRQRDVLKREADDAKAAVKAAWQDARRNLGKAIDPRLATKSHPWIALAAAAAAGFATVYVAVPSREERALRRLARIERALGREAAGAEANGKSPEARQAGLAARAAAEIFKTLRPALLGALTSLLNTRSGDPNDPADDAPTDSIDPDASPASPGQAE